MEAYSSMRAIIRTHFKIRSAAVHRISNSSIRQAHFFKEIRKNRPLTLYFG